MNLIDAKICILELVIFSINQLLMSQNFDFHRSGLIVNKLSPQVVGDRSNQIKFELRIGDHNEEIFDFVQATQNIGHDTHHCGFPITAGKLAHNDVLFATLTLCSKLFEQCHHDIYLHATNSEASKAFLHNIFEVSVKYSIIKSLIKLGFEFDFKLLIRFLYLLYHVLCL